MRLLDGTRDRAALIADLVSLGAHGEAVPRLADGRVGVLRPVDVEGAIFALARAALLVA